jgi:HEAT repeat protein
MDLVRTSALVLLLLLRQETPQDWIRQLGSDDPKVRDSAGSRLLNEGEKLRGLLQKATESSESEISLRARKLIGRLNGRKIEQQWSGAVGKTGFWIEREAFDLLGDENNLPESMKPLLHDEAEATFAFVRLEGAVPELQDILTARVQTLTEEQADRYGYRIFDPADQAPKLIRHSALGTMDSGLEVNGEPQIWDYGLESRDLPFGEWWKPAQPLRFCGLFKAWPELKNSSLLFVAPSDSGKSLEQALLEALSNPRRSVRLAAAAALERYFTSAAVEGLLRRLSDPEVDVLRAASKTLKKIAQIPEGTPSQVRQWWSKIKEPELKELLLRCMSQSRRPPEGEFRRTKAKER